MSDACKDDLNNILSILNIFNEKEKLFDTIMPGVRNLLSRKGIKTTQFTTFQSF